MELHSKGSKVASVLVNSRKLYILKSKLWGKLRLFIVMAFLKGSKVKTENPKNPRLIQNQT